ncbi:hypothetical protein N7495_010063 [Penicillium taxi]|uniref:uncharacterized protein n=1 Tax=Penicillium taxi TaxID=168475 RepID=UPI002544D6B4|nr:uncharacterized protein N7495_010063 [Penicillium taxi]KAJ5885553.1 hypothetical protein N7495_010063 [Penicillium taxi]
MNSHQQTACDRCRGQKLRCVGLANPVLDRHSRYVRNQTPCDRCKKAQVECYSTRSIARKRAASKSLSSDSNIEHSSSYPRYSALQSPESPLPCFDVSTWSENGDLDKARMIPWTGDSPLNGLHPEVISAPGSNISSHNAFDLAIENFLPEEANLSEDPQIISDGAAYSGPREKNQALIMSSGWLKKLAELNGTLLHNRANRQAGQSRGQSQPASTRSGSSVSLSIGQTLRHCQYFLSILQTIQRRATSYATNNSWRANGPDCGLDFPLSELNSDSGYREIRAFELLDPPLLFSILASYAYITEEYEHLFSSILESVTQAIPKVPATLVGTSLDGFKLDGNNTLQLEFVLYVSSNLLGKIESILIGSSDETGASKNDGLLSGKMAGYLESLYNHNYHGTEEATTKNEEKARVRVLIRQIQAALKTLEP